MKASLPILLPKPINGEFKNPIIAEIAETALRLYLELQKREIKKHERKRTTKAV
jgi:hypothetical protein